MRRQIRSVTILAAAAATAVTLGFTAAGASAGTGHGSRPLPHQVFAPYFEMYNTAAGPATLAQQSGSKFLSLAFLQTAQSGSCTAYWDGDPTTPISAGSFGTDIAAIQASGGN